MRNLQQVAKKIISKEISFMGFFFAFCVKFQPQ